MSDQPSIFDGIGPVTSRSYSQKPKTQRAVAHGACGLCRTDEVGLVSSPGQHLSWKVHFVSTWGGSTIQCQASGQHLCAVPARDIRQLTGTPPPFCPHQKEHA